MKRQDPTTERVEEKKKLIEREAYGRVHSGPEENTNQRHEHDHLHGEDPIMERERREKLGREKLLGGTEFENESNTPDGLTFEQDR